MSYLIRAVGIDTAPISSGVSLVSMRAGTWETLVLDAGVVHVAPNNSLRQTKFNQHMSAARKFVDFVKKHRPDLVGVEDYTNQSYSHVGFSMGELGGIIRLMLWQEGYRQLLISPGRIGKMVTTNLPKIQRRAEHPKESQSKRVKLETIAWLRDKMGVEFSGRKKEVEDMAGASLYAIIAACFFSAYWLKQTPPLSLRQLEILNNKPPHPSSKMAKSGWQPTGLLDRPYRYLIRNVAKEAETYSPQWLSAPPPEVLYVGDGTAIGVGE